MNKTTLIIKREYLSRVRKKSFIVMSIIGPILFGALMLLPAWFASMDDDKAKHIAVIDHSNKYASELKNSEKLKFHIIVGQSEEMMKENYNESNYDAFLVIANTNLITDDNAVKIFSEGKITQDIKNQISRNLKTILEQEYLQSLNIEGLPDILKKLRTIGVHVTTIKLGDDGKETKSSTEITMILSIVFSMMVYMFVLIYGTQVMRGVMEEKSNRIIEVIISSVKPFQLMMGKIIGIAMVALTQFLIWIVLTFVIVGGVSAISGSRLTNQTNPQTEMMQQINPAMANLNMQAQASGFDKEFENVMDKIDWSSLFYTSLLFLYFFIGGYLLYAALFAAVGSAVDSDTDSQQFVLPIMMPLILSIYIAMSAFKNPDSDMAFWFSMIPFTSPVVMMARIPFDIPAWEIILSMVILALSFVGATYMAARIYRTGILMYGKKVTYREMWKWFRESGR